MLKCLLLLLQLFLGFSSFISLGNGLAQKNVEKAVFIALMLTLFYIVEDIAILLLAGADIFANPGIFFLSFGTKGLAAVIGAKMAKPIENHSNETLD